MYKVVKWRLGLDLDRFYKLAGDRGFDNNSSYESMIAPLETEREWAMWIAYHGGYPIAASGAHSLDIIPGYRICVRTCVLSDQSGLGYVRGKVPIVKHKNLAAQIFMPIAIEWAGKSNDFYITTNDSDIASQRQVHNTYMPMLERMGTVSRYAELYYRGHFQTFWKVNVDVLYEQLETFGRWEYYLPS